MLKINVKRRERRKKNEETESESKDEEEKMERNNGTKKENVICGKKVRRKEVKWSKMKKKEKR